MEAALPPCSGRKDSRSRPGDARILQLGTLGYAEGYSVQVQDLSHPTSTEPVIGRSRIGNLK